MKFLPFVFKHLRATWVRTASTVVAMALCVFLFCTLRSVLAHFDRFDRRPQPAAPRHAQRREHHRGRCPSPTGPASWRVPGVKRVAATVMFGGVLPARKEGKADPGADAGDRLDHGLPEPRGRRGALLRDEPRAHGAARRSSATSWTTCAAA